MKELQEIQSALIGIKASEFMSLSGVDDVIYMHRNTDDTVLVVINVLLKRVAITSTGNAEFLFKILNQIEELRKTELLDEYSFTYETNKIAR